MTAAHLARLPAALRARRDVLEAQLRWADSAVLACGDAAVVLATEVPGGDLLWALGDVDELDVLLPAALVEHGPGVRWLTVPRAVVVPDAACAAAGIGPRTVWDRLSTDVPPPRRGGEDDVVALDPARDAPAIAACVAVANPTTRTAPGAPDDEACWGVRGADGALLGVIGARREPGDGAHAAHLHGLGVVPSARGRGLGAALAAVATRHALGGGAAWVSLGMYADNMPARRVYEALGFRVEVRLAGYGPTGVPHP